MKRLYLQIYLAFVGTVLSLVALAMLAWALAPASDEERELFEGAAAVASELLPPADAAEQELIEALEGLADRLHLHLAVRDPHGSLVASAGGGRPLPPPLPGREESHFLRSRGGGLTVALRLDDGRWLVARHPRSWHRGAAFGLLLLFAGAIAAGAYPLARRLTGRLERLQERVEALGAGELSVRVEVEGRDEVAELARTFNRTAERIERLVLAQKNLLAGASHELRSPLARIRMGLELALGSEAGDGGRRRKRIAGIERDIEELDGLIEELLLASRLDTLDGLEHPERVDVLALVAEEANRLDLPIDVAVSGARTDPTLPSRGSSLEVEGDRRLIRRMVRNLLENAVVHGKARYEGLEVALDPLLDGPGLRLRISDRGPGVPEPERERIFEPFYRSSGGVRPGVGLGLALVRQIARHHGGEARCLERVEGGSSFEVTLK